ncbi:hypothetical protein JXB37_03820 [candidate division WOR-3 bacterium]|nr:hypothetical protein [candidate division WOR-3 bacterium]
MEIGPDTEVGELVEQRPAAVKTLIRLGLPCLVCGEAFWGTVAELCERYGKDVGRVVAELRREQG